MSQNIHSHYILNQTQKDFICMTYLMPFKFSNIQTSFKSLWETVWFYWLYLWLIRCTVHTHSLALILTKHTSTHTYAGFILSFSLFTSAAPTISKELSRDLNLKDERNRRRQTESCRKRERKMNVGYTWTLHFLGKVVSRFSPKSQSRWSLQNDIMPAQKTFSIIGSIRENFISGDI